MEPGMLLLSLLLLAARVLAIGQKTTISFEDDGIPLAVDRSSVRIFAEQDEWPAVLRATVDLAVDFGRVTGVDGSLSLLQNGRDPRNASMIYNVTGRTSFAMDSGSSKQGGVIIVGTVGHSAIIERLSLEGKMDYSAIKDTWEAYTSTIVSAPFPGVDQAMVIVGSDRRGTIYGIYSVSEQIGVSPWYYWADSAPQNHSAIYATKATVTQKSPSVKYRGFFLNDEAPALTGYVDAKFPPGRWGPGFNADFYHTVFELLLRLRANYLWPAQWNSMMNADDARSQPLADEYGIVMGTSHTEPLMCATKEWNVFGHGPWQWNTNNASIRPFFEECASRAKPYEGVLTMGMRGSGDTALAPGIETDMLEGIVQAQLDILGGLWGNESVQDPNIVPQSWCLYKEVQGYYEAGMRVPDHITLLWTDDNFGNIRRLPLLNETTRSGGAGVYYHFDYVGPPRNYKWINTVQLAKTWEQMSLAYERDARRIWLVNVGDLKPLELPISHFFDLAYDITLWDKDSVKLYLKQWAAREFGPSVAADTAELMNQYSLAASRRKFEHVDMSTYSLINYDEADRVLAEWSVMKEAAESIMQRLPDTAQPSFFEMVYHPVAAGHTYYDLIISAAMNNLYAMQGRNSANAMAQRTLARLDDDYDLSSRYNNLLDGKWQHMMDQTHIGYTYWQAPMRQTPPGVQYVVPSTTGLAGNMGVAIESTNATVPGDDMYHKLSSNMLTMAPCDPYGVSSRWIEIFSTGALPFEWNITSNSSFVSFSHTSGHITTDGNTDARVWAVIDWERCPRGSGMVLINITSSLANATFAREGIEYGTQYSAPQLLLPYNNTELPTNFTNGFVESDGHMSIELEHYSSIRSNTSQVRLEVIPGLSRTLSGVTLFPVTADSLSTSTAPALEYKLYTFSDLSNGVVFPANLINVTIVTTASLNTIPARPLRYAVQFDSHPAQVMQYIIDQPAGATPLGWEEAVGDNAWASTANFTYSGPGEHILRLWALEPGVVFNTAWINLGGMRRSYLGPPESPRVP